MRGFVALQRSRNFSTVIWLRFSWEMAVLACSTCTYSGLVFGAIARSCFRSEGLDLTNVQALEQIALAIQTLFIKTCMDI